MSAPPESFAAELAACREIMLRKVHPADVGLVTAFLDGLRDYPEAEERIWQKIVQASKTAPPRARDFIAYVIDTRLYCERLARVIEQSPKLQAKAERQADEEFASGNPFAAAVVRHELEKFAKVEARLGRKKRSAPRKHFIRELNRMFVLNCGLPLHEVVAALTGIAFEKNVSSQNVMDLLSKSAKQDIQGQKRRRMSLRDKRKRG